MSSLDGDDTRRAGGINAQAALRLTRTGRLHQTLPMGYYLLEYVLVENYLARRGALREAHLALAREASRCGDLVLAGALAEPPDRAVLIWRTDDRSVVERFVRDDPYVRHGLVTFWTIRRWTVVIGDETATTPVGPG